MIDDRQTTPSSRAEDLLLWNHDANAFGWRSYLGDAAGGGSVDGQAAPARATDLTGLPPTLVLAAGADGFRDEDVDYVLRLSAAGVSSELHLYPGAPHGFTVVMTRSGPGQDPRRHSRPRGDRMSPVAIGVGRTGAGVP